MQVDLGKNTLGYQRYRAAVPRCARLLLRSALLLRVVDATRCWWSAVDTEWSCLACPLYNCKQLLVDLAARYPRLSYRDKRNRKEHPMTPDIYQVHSLAALLHRTQMAFVELQRQRAAAAAAVVDCPPATHLHCNTHGMPQVCSKRAFDGQVKKWRRMLHEWDLPDDAEQQVGSACKP